MSTHLGCIRRRLACLAAISAILGASAGALRADGQSRTVTVKAGDVIPFHLDNDISSADAHPGDRFTGTVLEEKAPYWRAHGATVEGLVLDARPKDGRKPGMLSLGVTRLRASDGREFDISATVVRLDSKDVARSHGRFQVRRGYEPQPFWGSTYKAGGTRGHDVRIGKDTELGLVFLRSVGFTYDVYDVPPARPGP